MILRKNIYFGYDRVCGNGHAALSLSKFEILSVLRLLPMTVNSESDLPTYTIMPSEREVFLVVILVFLRYHSIGI